MIEKYAWIAGKLKVGDRIAVWDNDHAQRIKRGLSENHCRGECSRIRFTDQKGVERAAWLVVNAGIPPHLTPICHNCRIGLCRKCQRGHGAAGHKQRSVAP
jgi:hypothetical protein